MVAVRRGRISAIVMLICATSALSPSARADNAPEALVPSSISQPSATISEGLLNGETAPTVDADWMLKDDRRTLLGNISVVESAPLPIESPNMGTLASAPATGLPHVDAPVLNDNATQVNDKLVPVPVLSVGSMIVLCAILFRLGARILRLQRVRTA
jgi:hypothetical protein